MFKKVKSGEPISIEARTFNTLLDSADDFLRRSRSSGGNEPSVNTDADVVIVKNAGTQDVGRFGVLALDDVVFSPDTALAQFLDQPVLQGKLPQIATHLGRFGVAIEPIRVGSFGRCIISGLVTVKVYSAVADAGPLAVCDIADGHADYLTVNPGGSARILWRKTGTGAQWAVVRIGGAGVGTMFFAKVVNCRITTGTGRGFFECKEVGDVSFDANGRLTGTVISGAPSFWVFGGVLGWSEKDDVVSLVPHRGTVNGIPVRWRIYDDQMGLNYNNSPATDGATLAPSGDQDSPGVHSFCTDTVTPT